MISAERRNSKLPPEEEEEEEEVAVNKKNSIRRADICRVRFCKNRVFQGRLLCEQHAFPGEHRVSNRKAAIEHTKNKNRKKPTK